MSRQAYFTSDLSKNEFPVAERISAAIINPNILDLLQKEHSDFDATKFLALSELNEYRQKYIAESLRTEVGALTELEQKVLDTVNGLWYHQ